MANHKAGFVNIVGKPNAGKSTLLNQLMGEKLAIVTQKAQTTRHRIFGIYNEEDLQSVEMRGHEAAGREETDDVGSFDP